MPRSPRFIVHTLILAVALAAFGPASPASADVGPVVTGCAGQALEQPFLPWLDPAYYVLAPNGEFEDGAGGWTLSGAAAVAPGNEPFFAMCRARPGSFRSARSPAEACGAPAYRCRFSPT